MTNRHLGILTIALALAGSLLIAVPSAQASTEHVVTLELVFEGSGCPLSTVVVSAASCDPADIAAELPVELAAEGLSSPNCLFSPTLGDWECLATFPSTCTVCDSTLSVKPGSGCADDDISGTLSNPIGTFIVFIFDVF